MADSFTVEINDKIAPSIAQKLDTIAKASGASSDAVDALKKQINTIGKGPIDSLEAAVKAATNSIDAEGKAVNKLTSELNKLDVQTRKAQNAAGTFKKEFTGFRSDQLANIGFQLQDIIVSLQGGQKPLTVFLQQGGQIGQVFGQAGASATQGLGAIGRIIVSFINPLTIVLGLFVAAGAAIYSFVSFRSDIDDLSKRLGTSAQSTEALYKSLYKISGLSIADQNKELTSIGLALNKAANDPENDLNERFKKNGLSITDAAGKLKPFEQNMKSIVALIQNAKSEFDAIDIASQVGASQELATSLYRAKEGLGDLKSDAKDALDPLQKSAADFDRNAAEYWRNFVLYAKSAIQEVGKFLYDLLNNLPTDPIGTLVTKAIGAVKGAPGAVGKAIGEMNSQEYGPISVIDRIGGNSRKVAAQNFQDRFNGGLVGDVDSALAKGLQAKADALNGKKAPREVLPTGKTTDNSKIEKEKKAAKPKFDVEEDINIKLDQQIARLKMLRPERELQQQLDEIDNKLRRQGKTLNDEERAAITAKVTEIERLKGVQREMDAIYDSTVGIQEKYNNTLEAANNLLAKGVINQDQYSKAVGDAKIKINEANNTIGAGVENGLLKTVQEYGNTTSAVSSTVTRSFDGLADGLASFASNSKFSFSDLSRSILADVTKMIIRIAVLKPLLSSLTGGGSSLGSIFSGGAGLDLSGGLNLLGGTVPGLPAFSTGGDIKVGGNGGTDSQTVAFRASPNETVSIRRPGQSDGSNVKVEVNNYGSNTQAEVQKTPNGSGGFDYKVLVKDIESRIAQGISTGTSPVAKASQQRYGLDPARGAR